MTARSSWLSVSLLLVAVVIASFLAGRGTAQDEVRPRVPTTPTRCILTIHSQYPNDPNYQDLRIEFDPQNPPDLSHLRQLRDTAKDSLR